MSSPTVVSAPGKVLAAGGYLVLDPAHSGLVIATSARFYTAISVPSSPAPRTIRVRSPQFEDATWVYTVFETGEVEQSSPGAPNKFVQLALAQTLKLAREYGTGSEALQRGLDITIAGDNDFYSQRDQLKALSLPPTVASLSHIPPFVPTHSTLKDVAKTGMGSSAALITSLTSALLIRLGVLSASDLQVENGREQAHNLAQFVHCFAQGKVGSGFDVASAVFGSQLYTRFRPAVLAPLMDDPKLSLAAALAPRAPGWDHKVVPFALPPSTRLLLADVHMGSNTPLLVGQVLKWRAANPEESTTRWAAIDARNTALATSLSQLSKLHKEKPEVYESAIKLAAGRSASDWASVAAGKGGEEGKVIKVLAEAHTAAESVRTAMRALGTACGVDIEPAQQTELLDASCALPGVLGGGVPGAGGFDAIWLLLLDPTEEGKVVLDGVEKLWGEREGVTPLRCSESDKAGVQVEDLGDVPGLKALVDAPW
ncbi:unnamed protein product [Peniophora sp. CBMAI 1063]|nr:unnamed protein product [Peniophora sp. CBMAI 1063]